MATHTIHIDDAAASAGTPTFVTDGSAITDNDLATYVDLSTPPVGLAETITANFSAPPATATSVTMTIVAARLTDTLARLVCDIFDQLGMDVGSQYRLEDSPINTPITYTRTFDDAYFAPGGQGETEDFVNPAGLTFADFLAALNGTQPFLQFFTNQDGPGTKIVRLYTVSLTYEGAGVFPLRRYPPVNNGGSGPTRHYPRAVNRRAGGTY